MKGIDMKEINRRALSGVAWARGIVLIGPLATLALVVLMAVLTAVMLTATVLPTTTVRQKGDLRGRRDSENTSKLSAPRKAVAS